MPNWTDNTLIITVPADKADAFCAALEGPDDWVYPIDALHDFERPKVELSAHEKVAIEGDLEAHVARFRAHMGKAWPDWMKPGYTDIALFLKNPDHRKEVGGKTVPFSIPAISPWADKADFDRFFPEEDPTSPIWTGSSESSQIIGLRNDRIGVKWPPGDIRLDREDLGARCKITIRYTTPWSPIETLPVILSDVLAAHDARAVLLWIEEQGYCGYQLMQSDGDTWEDSFDAGRFNKEVEEDDDVFHEFDHQDFETTVAEIISDEDLM